MKIKYWFFAFAAWIHVTAAFCSALPESFVYLEEVDPTIIQSLRYAGKENFVGSPVEGYESSRAIMTKQAAQALKSAQTFFKDEGYSLVVYDAYRPQRAVNHFMKWKDQTDNRMKTQYYPRVDKGDVFNLGYVAAKSGHSRGSTVDITLIPLGNSLHSIKPTTRQLNDKLEILFLDDGTVDMGSSFDLFDKASHYDNDLVSAEHRQMRTLLKEGMEKCGFKNYAEEWWHFTLKDEPFPDNNLDNYFDFPIK
jgi:D-alanyl-D-alanine dipeptidase